MSVNFILQILIYLIFGFLLYLYLVFLGTNNLKFWIKEQVEKLKKNRYKNVLLPCSIFVLAAVGIFVLWFFFIFPFDVVFNLKGLLKEGDVKESGALPIYLYLFTIIISIFCAVKRNLRENGIDDWQKLLMVM